ncbi:YkgJ family cysteine cluster protein [bacterium]|nr:YkgJ family cysteine cluster protein [bacterium]
MLTTAEKSELCLKCLICCKQYHIPTTVTKIDPVGMEWYTTRGISFLKHPENGTLCMVVPFKCPHLTAQGCDIYKKRPFMCRNYNGDDDPFMRDICLWVKENNVNI